MVKGFLAERYYFIIAVDGLETSRTYRALTIYPLADGGGCVATVCVGSIFCAKVTVGMCGGTIPRPARIVLNPAMIACAQRGRLSCVAAITEIAAATPMRMTRTIGVSFTICLYRKRM